MFQNETTARKILISGALLLTGFWTTPLLASTINPKSCVDSKTQSLNLKCIAKLEKLRKKNSTSVDIVNPKVLSKSDNQSEIAQKIVGHQVDNALESLKEESKVVKAAYNVSKSLKTNVKVNKHKFDLEFNASQSIAALKYSGLMSAHMNFHLPSQELQLGMNKELTESLTLQLEHLQTNTDFTERVSMTWSW